MTEFKKTVLLTRTMLKGEENTTFAVSSFSNENGKKKTRRKKNVNKVLAVFFALVAVFWILMLVYQISRIISNPLMITSMSANLTMIFTVFYGFLYTVATLYFSKDLSLYLTMPLKETTIVAAKQTQLFIQLMIVAVFAVPMNIGIAAFTGMPPLFYVYGILQPAFVVIPIMCLLSIIIMMLMRFTRLFRNKDRFAKWAGLLLMVFAIGIVVLIQSQRTITEDGGYDYTDFINNTSENETLNIIRLILVPSSGLMQKAFSHADSAISLVYLFGVILITAVYIGLLMLAARKLYLAGALNMQSDGKKKSDSNKSRKNVSGAKSSAEQLGKRKSPVMALLIKDIKMLVRVPSFFTNTLLGSLMMPIIMIVVVLINMKSAGEGVGLAEMREAIGAVAADPAVLMMSLYFAGLFTIGITGFIGATISMISMSAISREGGDFYLLKVLPFRSKDILTVKLIPGLFISLVSWLVILIPAGLILQVPPGLFLPLAAIILFNTVTDQFIALLLDLKMAKLDWTNEIQMQKRSGIVFAMMGILITAAALQIGLIIWIKSAIRPIPALYVAMFVGIPLLCMIIAGLILFLRGPKLLAKIN